MLKFKGGDLGCTSVVLLAVIIGSSSLNPVTNSLNIKLHQLRLRLRMTTLTAAEREAALSQVTAMGTINAALSMSEGGSGRRCVPIVRNEGEIWVAVNPVTNTVSADVPQPDPGRQVLCSGEGNYGNMCYCYADQLPISIICTLIFAGISVLVFTPLSLLCFIPMLQHLRKVRKIDQFCQHISYIQLMTTNYTLCRRVVCTTFDNERFVSQDLGS